MSLPFDRQMMCINYSHIKILKNIIDLGAWGRSVVFKSAIHIRDGLIILKSKQAFTFKAVKIAGCQRRLPPIFGGLNSDCILSMIHKTS